VIYQSNINKIQHIGFEILLSRKTGRVDNTRIDFAVIKIVLVIND
jgi:hypothetical protein